MRRGLLLWWVFCTVAGTALALGSTFVAPRTAAAIYPDIMGCERGCEIVATGWPLVFVRDYLGMSVVGRAEITEVWFAADRFDWLPFLIDAIAWTVLAAACLIGLSQLLQHGPRSPSQPRR